MPLEGNIKLAKRTAGRLSSLTEDAAVADGAVDAPFRVRLHSLFAQIEKEFEALYLENLNRMMCFLVVSNCYWYQIQKQPN